MTATPVIRFTVRYVRPYFSKRLMCHVPGGWEAETIGETPNDFDCYTGRCASEAAAMAELVAQAKRVYGAGVLRRA